MTAIVVRPLAGPGDDAGVDRVFRSTLAMGRPLPFDLPVIDTYADLCLGWYLTVERSRAAVVELDGQVVGYALVCTDTGAQHRWARRRSVRFVRRAAGLLARRALGGPARHFVLLRMRDAVALGGAPAPHPVHAHLNLDRGAQRSNAGLLLRQHIDDVCRSAGARGWYGEVNAQAGRRAIALERLVGRVVHRAPNRTCSWLAGSPVERLTVVRDL